jgi:hypothetical protein
MAELDPEVVELVAMVGPHQGSLIAEAAPAVAADIRYDAERLGTDTVTDGDKRGLRVLDLLPPQTFTQSRLWRHQLAEAAAALADDTRRWGLPLPRCTGEEMVLHLILRRAAAADGCPHEQVETWTTEPDDPGWGDLFECLFQDHDVPMLYDMPAQSAERAGGVNLDPPRWFSEFSLPCPVPTDPNDPAPDADRALARTTYSIARQRN